MRHLSVGTIVDFDTFSTLVVGEDLLLVYESADNAWVSEGQLLTVAGRGPNDWTLSIGDDRQRWNASADYWVHQDWNGHVKSQNFDPYDNWENDEYEDWSLEEWLKPYEEYDW